MALPLSGLLVVSLEQAVAAPMCACRLADAGARVIKIERPEGDFARTYDTLAGGESAYFVWLNRGKQSVVLDLGKPDDKALLEAMLARADVFVQNLKPGAVGKLGFAVERLRRDYPRLIVASISGYGETGPYAARKAYDLLIQAEAGVASVTGAAEAPSRVGVSIADIGAGLYAYEAILEALLARGRTGEGAALIGLAVRRHGRLDDGAAPAARRRQAAAAHRPRASLDRALRRVQEPRRRRHSDRHSERPRVARSGREGAGRPAACRRPGFRHQCGTGEAPRRDRRPCRRRVRRARCRAFDRAARRRPTSPSRGSTVRPSLRAIRICAASRSRRRAVRVAYPAPAAQHASGARRYGAVPALGEHTEAVRAEFLPSLVSSS